MLSAQPLRSSWSGTGLDHVLVDRWGVLDSCGTAEVLPDGTGGVTGEAASRQDRSPLSTGLLRPLPAASAPPIRLPGPDSTAAAKHQPAPPVRTAAGPAFTSHLEAVLARQLIDRRGVPGGRA